MISSNEYKFAGFWVRFVVAIIDGILTSLPALLYAMFFLGNDTPSDANFATGFENNSSNDALPDDATEVRPSDLFFTILTAGYYIVLTASSWQSTVGKRMLGIYVVDVEGNRISTMRSIGRYFSYFLSIMTLCIGFIIAGLREDKRALHDLVAGTFVVYGKPDEVDEPNSTRGGGGNDGDYTRRM